MAKIRIEDLTKEEYEPKELEYILGKSYKTILKLIHDKQLKAKTAGKTKKGSKSYIIKKEDLLDYLGFKEQKVINCSIVFNSKEDNSIRLLNNLLTYFVKNVKPTYDVDKISFSIDLLYKKDI